jgi:AraC family transcriptional regulator of adaptative response / DNA-3-methyladenine glycosylase II
MRALGDPDVWLGTDLGVRHALTALGAEPVTPEIERCRPWRSYAVMHLWHTLEPPRRTR